MILGQLSNLIRFPTKLEYAAEQLANNCLDQIWDRVAHRAPELSANQARGYIRARAGLIVMQNVNATLNGAPEAMRAKLTELSMDRIVSSLVQRSRTVNVPALALRRAA